MTNPAPHSAPGPTGTKPPSSASPIRLLVLVGLLSIVIGAWAYDYWVAGPGSEATYQKIQVMVDEMNAKGVRDGGVVRSEDVQKTVGFAPTWVEKKPDYVVEWYCWWGKIPVLSTWKRYITVVYVGEPPHFNTHHQNEPPPAEALPGYLDSLPMPKVTPEQASHIGGMAPGGGGGPGMAPPPDGAPPKGPGRRGPGRAEISIQGDASKDGNAPTPPKEGDKPAETTTKEGDKPAETTKEGDKPAGQTPNESAKPAEAAKEGDKPVDSPNGGKESTESPK
jgi:hypothetical protein